MNEFDDLLNEILSQEGNQQLPPGMERRIVSALPVERNQFSTQRAIWVGTAAVLLMGVVGAATWTMVRTGSSFVVAPASEQISLTRLVDPAKLVESQRPGLPSAGHEPSGRKSMASLRPRLASQQRAIRIAPVVFEPVVIKPIEIAALTTVGSTTKGKLR
jgi:hypothetical protein